jgi:extracellular factor (EF) 3-hydroxypalmitic acid methyl ester biosynthesis protein
LQTNTATLDNHAVASAVAESALHHVPDAATGALPGTAAATTGTLPDAAPVTLQQRVLQLLDRAQACMAAGDSVAAFRLLTTPLAALWSEARASARADDMQAWCNQHPIHPMAIQDPFTERARNKPRGYAGDAVMMDYIYSGVPPAGSSALGQQIFAATTRAAMGLSVRFRRDLLRSLIDDTVVTTPGARIFSVACGHARELDGSLVGTSVFDGEFVALDQDFESCAEVERAQAGRRVRVLNQGVRELMSLTPELATTLGRFDLIYSAGLYDYLPDSLARRLTTRLLQLLQPGGRLLIGNFVPAGTGRGYMELFMDWTLILRNEAQMVELAHAAGAKQVRSFVDAHHNVAYVELRHAVEGPSMS